MQKAAVIGVAVLLSGCAVMSEPTQVEKMRADIHELQNRIHELEQELTRPSVNLINPNYPPAVAGEEGWEYHKVLVADLDADGEKETVSVTTNALWIQEAREFGWDDGHPWHVYVEEADGTRTYLFSDWVQMGRLDVILDAEHSGLYIVSSRAGGLDVYHAIYSAPDQVETVLAFQIPLSDYAVWADSMVIDN